MGKASTCSIRSGSTDTGCLCPVGQRQGEATGVYLRDCGYRSGESMLIAACESETVSEPAVRAMLLIVTGLSGKRTRCNSHWSALKWCPRDDSNVRPAP